MQAWMNCHDVFFGPVLSEGHDGAANIVDVSIPTLRRHKEGSLPFGKDAVAPESGFQLLDAIVVDVNHGPVETSRHDDAGATCALRRLISALGSLA